MEIGGQRCFELHSFTRHRMIETQLQRMQSLALDQHLILVFGKIIHQVRKHQCRLSFVKFVSDDWVPQVVQVHAKLVRSSGLRAQANEGKSIETFDNFIERRGMALVVSLRANHHTLAVAIADSDVCFDVVPVK